MTKKVASIVGVGSHALAMAALAGQMDLVPGDHDIMEAQPLTEEERRTVSTANAVQQPEESRQVRRANARMAKKKLRRHMTEHVAKKNRKR